METDPKNVWIRHKDADINVELSPTDSFRRRVIIYYFTKFCMLKTNKKFLI